MAGKHRVLKLFLGLIVGATISHIVQKKSRICGVREESDRIKVGAFRQNQNYEEGLIFIGVMTAQKYLESRAEAIHSTWGQTVPGKLQFFSSEVSFSKTLPLVSLIGIDDSYPPQKKSFAMLKYIHDHYIDKYEWFMRADDDVYVRTDRLEKLLRSVDSSKPWFIGQTGKGNTDEFGLLSLDHDENFCMGGPGVIFSRETLKRIAPYMEQCLGSLFTTHEDVELGRCVKKFAGVSCTWSYEMQVILYHNQSGDAAFSGNLKQKEVHHAITLHPVKQPQYMHRLHQYVQGLHIQDNRHQSIALYRDLVNSLNIIKKDESTYLEVESLLLSNKEKQLNHNLEDAFLLGSSSSLTRGQSQNLNDVLDWEFFVKTIYSYKDLNPRKKITSHMKEGLNDIIRETMDILNSHSKQRGRIIDFKDIFYGYWRLDPIHGVDVILDLLLVYRKYRGHKMTVSVRRHSYLQQTFTGIDIREIGPDGHPLQIAPAQDLPFHKKMLNSLNLFSTSIEKTINFIMPLKGRYLIFKRFLKLFEKICANQQQSTKLIVVLYKDESNLEFDNTRFLIETTKRASILNIEVIEVDEPFSRGKALQIGASSLLPDDLMFFIDADIIFTKQALLRIRKNTVQGKTIYFPIVYSLYKPDVFNKSYFVNTTYFFSQADNEYSFYSIINEQNGFWRQFGFGIVALYKSDYIKVGGFNTSIVGWGLEDVTFFDSAIKTNLKVIRSPDPGLIHVYHPINCDNLDNNQNVMCIGTKNSLYGSLSDLEQYIYWKREYLLR